jgi:hypothetical protein
MASIDAYLDAGGSPAMLLSSLRQAYDPTRNRDVADLEVLITDLTGDQVAEIVIAASLWVDVDGVYPATSTGLTVFECRNSDYEVVYQSAPPPQSDVCYSNYDLSAEYDITESGGRDLLISEDTGCDRCEEAVIVLSDASTQWTASVVDTAACHAEVSVADLDNRGLVEVLILGPVWQPVAWSSRPVLRSYGFDEDAAEFTLLSIDDLPPIVRPEALHDAQSAVDAGEYMRAWAYYLEAATSDRLGEYPSRYEWESGIPDEVASSYQRAFARFRIVWLWVRLGYLDRAHAELEIMASLFPLQVPGGEFTALADSLVEDASNGLPISQACRRVSSTIIRNYPYLTGPNGHVGTWLTPELTSYTATDICPGD